MRVLCIGCLFLVVSLVLAASTLGQPPKVQKGVAGKLSSTEFDPSKWKQKTLKHQITVWFIESTDGWRIDWDAERRPLKRLIIHHSATTPDASPTEIESYTRRLYDRRYGIDEYQPGGNDPFVFGLPVHSGHVVGGKERFITYHHLIYPDGKVTTELSPVIQKGGKWQVDMVAWHADNWSVNCESLGVCLVGNYQSTKPTEKASEALNGLIAHYRTLVSGLLVEPHKQYKNTVCPGNVTWK